MTERTLRDQIADLPRYEPEGEPNHHNGAAWMAADDTGDWIKRDAVLALLDAHTAEQPAPDAVAEAPTDGQLVSACLSYNHGYGLMDPEHRDKLHFQCREWWRSIARAINDGDRP